MGVLVPRLVDQRHRKPWKEREDLRWAVRGSLESAGLRVVSLLPVTGRPGRWFAQVMADGVAPSEVRELDGVLRISALPGSPNLLMLTIERHAEGAD